LHLDGTQHDPDVVGPQLDDDESNEALTTREYVYSVVSSYSSVLCQSVSVMSTLHVYMQQCNVVP